MSCLHVGKSIRAIDEYSAGSRLTLEATKLHGARCIGGDISIQLHQHLIQPLFPAPQSLSLVNCPNLPMCFT